MFRSGYSALWSFLSKAKQSLSFTMALALVGQSVLFAQTPWPTQTIGCAEGFGVAPPVAAAPITLLKSLKTIPNPVLPNGATGAMRADLAPYILNQTAAIQLGKALFWEMQAGSDNKTACATCHFQAGADTRTKNQVHPGANGTFEGMDLNTVLSVGQFPLATADANVPDKSDNNIGSQGVRSMSFTAIDSLGNEITNSVPDTTFGSLRRVTGMNAPTTINAVFNHRQFFNGRAQNEFNGANPFGDRDPNAQVWAPNSLGTLLPQAIRLDRASLASQAVGPPTNSVEMSAAGRTFPDIGRKLLKLKPLALQTVDTRDSVLGKLAETKIKGLKTTYPAMIQAAFQPKWWNATQPASIGGLNYSQMEANFSLYWGLAIMLYEATLVSDDSPMDQYLDGRTFTATGAIKTDGISSKLNTIAKRLQTDYGYGTAAHPSAGGGGVAGILNGLRLFERPIIPAPGTPAGRECIACHLGATTTSATIANVLDGALEPDAAPLKAAGFDLRMERMFEQIPGVPTDILGILAGAKPKFYTDQITFDSTNYAVNTTETVDNTGATPVKQPQPAPGIPAPVASYDAGWYNVGARPPVAGEDPGVGGTDPFGKPLAWVDYLPQTMSAPPRIPGGTLGCIAPTYNPGPTPPIRRDALGNPFFPNVVLNGDGYPLLSGQLKLNEMTDSAFSFKTSSLRNVELNAPYFHNGGKLTLRQVVELYDDGSDFPKLFSPDRNLPFPADRRSPLLKLYGAMTENGLGLTEGEMNDIVAFLIALTDERVRLEKAPFDHPELTIPAGESAPGLDQVTVIPAVGALGRATPLQPFLGKNPFDR